MSADISYFQLKVANEAREAVGFVLLAAYVHTSIASLAGRDKMRAKKAEFVGADSALFAGGRVVF